MFSQMFEERDRKIALLVKLGDCLGRSLRENVILFSIDAVNNEVTYLTESNKVLSGHYQIDADVTLKNIKVRNSAIFEDSEKYDALLTDKVHVLIESVYGNKYASADNEFSDILSLWESRLKFETLKKRLVEKSEKIKTNTNIIKTPEFQRALEIAPQVIKFLQENKTKFSTIPEIKNSVCLSETIAVAFNFPHLTFEELEANKDYKLKNGVSESIYEMICKQELVKKELLESKALFSEVWATSPAIIELASLIYEKDETIIKTLSKALNEVPYLAFASKKNLTEIFSNCIDEGIGIPENDIKEYSSKIFEFKKEVRDILTDLLSEKYGVNLQNLKEPPSFKSLVNTQIILFEALSRLAPNGSNIKRAFTELAESLNGKAGVESIDVNDFIAHIFGSAGFSFLSEKNQSLNRYTKVDMKRLQKDIEDIRDTVDLMKGKLSGGDGDPKDGDNDGAVGDEEPNGTPKKGEVPPEKGMPEKGQVPPKEEVPMEKEKPGLEKKPENGEMEQDTTSEKPGEEGSMEDAGMEEPTEEKDVMADLSDLEAMIDNLTAELGLGSPDTDGEEEEETLDTKKKTKVEKDDKAQDLDDEE